MTDMKDFDFDVMQKKSLVASARKRVNGSKSKKCTLPYEYLTPAQRRELNGKMESMNVNKPITWAELAALPPSMAKEYCETLHRVHKATIRGAARMLGIAHMSYRAFLERIGADIPRPHGHPRKQDVETYERFCGNALDEEAAANEPPAPAKETAVSPTPDPVVELQAKRALPMEPERMTIVINGNLEQLAAYIKLLPMDGRLRMTLTLERTEEEK